MRELVHLDPLEGCYDHRDILDIHLNYLLNLAIIHRDEVEQLNRSNCCIAAVLIIDGCELKL